MVINILFIMLLLHVIDDFHMQGIMKEMKQKSWWLKQKGYKDAYENDYMMVLFLHSLSWTIIVTLPIMLFMTPPSNLLVLSILTNTAIHYYVDDLKCNQMKINLVTDQLIHLIQILVTWVVFVSYMV